MSAQAKRVALFGGAFDPLHNGHLATISLLLSSALVDQVVVVPCGDRPDKPGVSAAGHRLAMAKLGVASRFSDDQRVTVSDAQASGKAGYATVDLLSYFKKTVPEAELFVIIGAELVPELHTWREPERLKKEAHLLVVRRPGAPEAAIPAGWKVTSLLEPYSAEVQISSTELRKRLAAREALHGLVPDAVVEYCARHRLYGPAS